MAEEGEFVPEPGPAAAPGESARTVRLASIVAVDVVGFSRMSERDQRKTARAIEALRTRIERVAVSNDGRVFNTAGDGFMLEFASAGSALGAINDLLDKKIKGEPPIRVGAHVGDVVVTVNNDLLGHGVNVAARLQSLSPPNTALVSGEFRSMARNSPSAMFQPKGRQPLENINQRVATFAIISQKKQLQKLLGRSLAGAAVAGVVALIAVFLGPGILRAIDEQDFFAKSSAGDAIASVLGKSAAKPVSVAPVEAVAPSVAPEPVKLGPKPGDKLKACDTCAETVVLAGGTFKMGSPATEKGRLPNEGAQRDVTVKPFAIGTYEVTFADWDACLTGGGCSAYSPPDQGWGRGRRPVIGVSWEDANGYVQWLNRQAGKDIYRLPTEAEWEYAARAGATTPYAFGASLKQGQAAFGSAKTDPVGSYVANAFGAFDMNGNASEWVADCYAPTLKDAPTDGSAVTKAGCTQRVYRGGSYADKVVALRSASRQHAAASLRNRMVGFRVVQIVE